MEIEIKWFIIFEATGITKCPWRPLITQFYHCGINAILPDLKFLIFFPCTYFGMSDPFDVLEDSVAYPNKFISDYNKKKKGKKLLPDLPTSCWW